MAINNNDSAHYFICMLSKIHIAFPEEYEMKFSASQKAINISITFISYA